MAPTVSASNHSSTSPTHEPKSMEVAVLGETIDEILKGIPSLATIMSGAGLSPSGIKQLQEPLEKIQDVVHREEQSHVHGDEVLVWLRSLKTAVNDLIDLAEELSANASPQERKTPFFKHNPIKHRLKVVNSKIKKVTEDLQGLASNLPKPSEEARKKKATKLPNLDPEIEKSLKLVGREKEKKEITDQLIFLQTRTEESEVVPVTVVTIVGVAGIGKTKLADLICEDAKVKARFGPQFRVHGFSDVESIEKHVSESPTTEGKGYLVVLNYLSAEIGDKCLSKLQQILTGPGGAILVTTRSKLVANKITASIRSNDIAANGITTFKPHVLLGLNEEDSRSLFRQIRGPSSSDMERKIVMDCGGVPQWIVIAARLLNNRGGPPLVSEAEVAAFKDELLQELKLMYYDSLPWRQKLCFASFSLFPRDHLIDPERLIHLWTAEAFLITTSDDSNSAEENLRGCFNDFNERPSFKDVEEDECGVVRRCRMQPLMHELARLVGDHEENITVDPDGERVHEGALRASFDFSLDWRGIPASLFGEAVKLRAILLWKTHYSLLPKEMKMSTSICDKIFKTFKSLRMLDLHELGIKTLPSSIKELKNLRYLDLSLNNIEKLPGSITKLSNLQTLKLSQCYLLEELPKNIEDLINLRHLEIEGCLALTHMPRKIHKLKSLQTLSLFVVSKDYHLGGLGELGNLNSLRGHLEILHLERLNLNLSKKDMCIKRKEHLQRVTLRWDHEDDREEETDEKTLECLEPHSELRVLFLVGYKGGKLSSWLASMQCLVKLSLYDCSSCKIFVQLDQLPNLRILEILRLDNLEFITENSDNDNDNDKAAVFFPSLEELTISDCPELKGWWKKNKTGNEIPFFACISKLHVNYCPQLTCMPLFPGLDEELVLVGSSVKPLEDTIVCGEKGSKNPFSKLKSMQIASVDEDRSLPEEWLKYFSSLEKLHIREWKHLESLPKGLDHLISLQSLTIENCQELDLDLSSTEWVGLQNLRSLTIKENPKLKSLPIGVDKVISLQDLELHSCPELSSLPESIGNLKSLGRLVISECNKLASLPKGLINLKDSLHTLIVLDCALLLPRCQPDTGDDWPQISHIKNKLVRENSEDI